MIQADKRSWFETIFSHYNENFLLRRRFHSITSRGEIDGGERYKNRPLLYVMNHSSWWDGLVIFQLFRRQSKLNHFVMMDEAQLARYSFFRRLGAFSIDKTSLRGISESLTYASQLLSPGNGLWIFPQGDIRHLEERPLRFSRGAGHLLSKSGDAVVIPVTAYYSLGLDQKPDVSIWFGQPVEHRWDRLGRTLTTQELQQRLTRQLDEHKALMVAANGQLSPGFRLFLSGNRSTDKRFDAFKRRASWWRSFFGR